MLCNAHGEDIDDLTGNRVHQLLFGKCRSHRDCHHSNKPLVARDLKVLLKEKKRDSRKGDREEIPSRNLPPTPIP